jgi:hypothetical protein
MKSATPQDKWFPPRTINGYVNRERSPPKKLGRNALLSADVKKQLHQRIVCLKHVGFVLT